jgi:hypothetical protein
MENNISIRIYVQRTPNGHWAQQGVWDYDIEGVMPQLGWEGQIDTEIVMFDESWSLDDNVCEDPDCYAGTRPHQHLYNSTAVIRAESRE